MGYLITNITHLLDKKHRYYNKEIIIYDNANNKKRKEIKLNPKEEYYLESDYLDSNIKRLSSLKYIIVNLINNKNQIIQSISENNEYINNRNINNSKTELKDFFEISYNSLLKKNKTIDTKDIKNNLRIKKFVSFIIPTFNNVEYIDQCVKSIKNNVNNNLEIEIIIGIDKCEKTKNFILNTPLFNDVELYYFNNNVGPYVIKNTLIKYAKYDNIIFFDSDDYFLDNVIKDLVDELDNNEYVLLKYQNIKDGVVRKASNLYAEGVIAFKKHVFLSQNGYYPWRCAADSEFRERSKYNGYSIYKHPKLCFYRRIHETNLTRSTDTGLNSPIRLGYRKLIEEFKNNNYPNPDKLYTEEDHIKL